MSNSLGQLDYSGWSNEALDRLEKFRRDREATKVYRKALSEHLLAGVADSLDEAAIKASEAPRLRFIARDFQNGLREVVVAREVPNPWEHLDKVIERDCKALAPRGEGDRDANVQRATRRAKQKVRHLCKAMAVNSLWTLTYRENVQDRELVLQHFDRFRRKVERWLPGWRYVAVLEKQERGAYHVHLATHALPRSLVVNEKGNAGKVKSWDLMRRLWRSVVGELGGNFDEAKRNARWSTQKKAVRGAGAIAAYIGGYVAKDMLESELNRKRYSCSKGIEVPEALRRYFEGDESMAELIALAYSHLGDRITRAWYDGDRGVFYAESDDTMWAPGG